MLMKVVKCPSDDLSKTNCAIVNAVDLPNTNHIKITVDDVNTFVLSVKSSSNIARKEIGFSALHRKWLDLVLFTEIDVVPFEIDPSKRLTSMTIEIDFLRRKNDKPETYNADEMAMDFLDQFSGILFSTKQFLAFDYKSKLFTVLIHELEAINIQDVMSGSSKPQKAPIGLLNKDTALIINKNENCCITLVGKSTGAQIHQSIIAPDFDFNELGIGGLDKEFAEVFRRAFASRMFSSNIVEQCGGKHVKGIMLYGPPGTGKTLIARKIGGMLRSHPPKVINGPEILNKFVGESEANIRRLFADAEDEEKRLGPASALHIIIFDEIDAICKQRATTAGGTGVHDTVVNQLLSKIDGVDQLNNVLIIGMTNRLDLIDDALLRPGRFEVKLQIGLPDEKGRLQILKIHTAKMLKNNRLAPDVNLEDLAKLSKNFTGAEIEALTRAALSIALNRVIKVTSKVEIDYDAADNLRISHNDFLLALENDVKPAFGTNSQFLDKFATNPFYHFSQEMAAILDKCHLAIKSLQKETKSTVYSILLEGAPNCGKTTLACKIALNAAFPFFKVCTLMDMLGYSENSKCLRIQKIFDDAYKSSLSCVLINDIENLIDYGPIGPRYSTVLLKNFEEILKNVPPKNHRLLIIATTESKMFLNELKLTKRFSNIFHVPNVTNLDELMIVLEESLLFDSSELEEISNELKFQTINIGIKKLLMIINISQQDVRKVDRFVQMFKDHQDEDD